jgi:hypothetical protein
MQLDRRIKDTLTPVELDVGDTLQLDGAAAAPWRMTLKHTAAEVVLRSNIQRGTPVGELPTLGKDGTLARVLVAKPMRDAAHYAGDIAVYSMTAVVEVNGREHVLVRFVGDQRSFYQPWDFDGVRVWFDAARWSFIHPPREGAIVYEKDWAQRYICAPGRAARFAVQQAGRPIAPEPVGAWYQGQKGVPDIRTCYTGQDCWMGPYNGAAAHCGLDINMLKGTRLLAPIMLDDQYVFNDARAGITCGRWRGSRRWNRGTPQESEWIIQTHHIVSSLVEERRPIARGTPYATGAGTAVGLVEHTHFMFRVIEQGGDYMLDPWILFWAALQE